MHRTDRIAALSAQSIHREFRGDECRDFSTVAFAHHRVPGMVDWPNSHFPRSCIGSTEHAVGARRTDWRQVFPVRRRNHEEDLASRRDSFSYNQRCWLRLLPLVPPARPGAVPTALPAASPGVRSLRHRASHLRHARTGRALHSAAPMVSGRFAGQNRQTERAGASHASRAARLPGSTTFTP